MAFYRINTDWSESPSGGTPILQQLEPRLLLSGVTLIAHGHNSGVSGWIDDMADAIADRIGAESAEYTLVLNEGADDKPNSHFFSADNPAQTYDAVASGEAIIKVDWSDMTSGLFDFGSSTTDVGYYVADWLAGSDFAGMPIHLIGHSRGASVSAAICQKLAALGVWVDQMTMLDPYPVDGDSDVILYDNVRLADNYYQTDYSISGGPIAGSYNLGPLDLGGAHGYFSGGTHSDVHLWYHGTIDLSPAASADGYTVPGDYYDGSQGPRDSAGFHYSLIAGGDRSELTGWLPQAANRTHVTRSGSQWANLEATLQLSGPDSVEQGDDIPLSYRYQAAIASDISFGFDTDRNPYNASAPQYAGTIAMPATSDGTAFDNGIAETHDVDTSQISPGEYYIVARITADGRSRYVYSDQQITIEQAQLLGDADGSGTVDEADIDIFAAEFGMRDSNLAADFDTDGYVGLSDFVILRENFGNTLPVASLAVGLVTSVNQSTRQTAPAISPTSPQAPVSTHKSVVYARQPQPTAVSFPPQSFNSELSFIAEARKPASSLTVERKLTGVLSTDVGETPLYSGDLLADILAESALATFS